MREYGTLKEFFLQYKWRYIWGIIWLLLVDGFQLLTPRLLGIITDELLSPLPDRNTLQGYIFLILAIALGVAIFRYLWRLYIIGTARLLEKSLRKRLFDHLQNLPARFYLQHKTGELMAHLTNDILAVRTSMGLSIVLLVDAVFITILALILMSVTVDLRLTLLALIPLPILAVVVQKLGVGVYKRFIKVQENFGDMTSAVQENIAASRVVRAFVLEEPEKKRFQETSEKYMQENFRLFKLSGLYNPLIYIFGILTFTIVLLFGGKMVITGTISPGDFVAFNGYLTLLTWPMLAIGWVINLTQRGRASMERINLLLEEKPEIFDDRNAHTLPAGQIEKDINFEKVSFRYFPGQEPVLKEISMRIPCGKVSVITGRTGSGKSTLAFLLLRLFEPDEGRICLGDRPLTQITLNSWRQAIAYVPQDNFIFSATIRENIALARPEATEEEIKQAAHLAALHGEIEHFPEGYDTVVGERGVTLSGGQQQRVALARALLANREYLILDDSFSSVDLVTEEKILRNLREVEKMNTTIIIISHRLPALRAADKVFVLEQGRLVEEGTHQGLLARESLYHSLCRQELWEQELSQNKKESKW